MRRGESIFELDLNAHDEVERGFELEGSNLSGVSARCSWVEQDPARIDINHFKDKNVWDSLQKDDIINHSTIRKPIYFEQNSSSTNFKMDEMRGSSGVLESTELMHIRKLDGVHLVFNLEAGSLLPLSIR